MGATLWVRCSMVFNGVDRPGGLDHVWHEFQGSGERDGVR